MDVMENRKVRVNKIISGKLRPRIDSCEGLPEVCVMAAKLIADAHKQKQHGYRYITFYGAAALAIPEAEVEEFGSVGGSGQQSPYQRYLGALEAATGDKVRIRRYVKLLTPEEFERRSFGVQREYINWLKGQYNMLSRNPNYTLADVVRAPQWGSKLARIITHDAMMEITGDGEAAVLITDDHLCETVRRYARETVVGHGGVKNKPKYYGQARGSDKTVMEFRSHYQDIEKLMATRGSSDDEEGEV